MSIPTEPTRGARVATILTSVALGACASLDTTRDLDEARGLVAARSDIDFSWSESWTPQAVVWPPERPLRADDVARMALHNHAGIRSTVESIARARAAFVQAHLLPNPVINFGLGLPIDGGGGHPAMGSLLQPLAMLWQRPAAIDAARSRLRAAVLTVSDAAIALVAAAKRGHARVVFAERDLVLERESRRLAGHSLNLAEQRFAEGEASGLERNQAALDVVEADMRVTEAESRRDRAVRTLLELCGFADELESPPIDATTAGTPPWIGEFDEREALELAEQQRLDLAAARALADGELDAVRLAELRRLRTVSIGASYERNFNGREAVAPTLGLELPLFDDGRAATADAAATARAARAEVERVRQSALAEVRSAWVRLRADLDHLAHVRHASLELATQNHELAERSLAAGVGDRPTVLEFARRRLRAELDVSRIELAVIESFLELERAAGGRVARSETEVE